MWFENLVGFVEQNGETVRSKLSVENDTMTSSVNGRTMTHGLLETPDLATLRRQTHAVAKSGPLQLHEVVADIQALHKDNTNAGALFQVASQFNLLEMMSPTATPEAGIDIYEHDHTQGPACAIACGAGTIYRNYFAPVNGKVGQSRDNQIDCLDALGAHLGNDAEQLWRMTNGYALATEEGLEAIALELSSASETERDELRGKLAIGLQRNTEVTVAESPQLVTQAFCSALPVAYSQIAAGKWEPFARLVLEASYEATICAAIVNASQTGNNRVFLTLLGGGAFGNNAEWIFDALLRSLHEYADYGLNVAIVSYGSSSPAVRRIVAHGVGRP